MIDEQIALACFAWLDAIGKTVQPDDWPSGVNWTGGEPSDLPSGVTWEAVPNIVWANQHLISGAAESAVTLRSGTARPRAEVAFTGIDPQQLGMKSPGGANRRRFLFQATVVTDEDDGHFPAAKIAERIVAQFASGREPMNGLWVRSRPATGPALGYEAEYRLPVTVRLETLS